MSTTQDQPQTKRPTAIGAKILVAGAFLVSVLSFVVYRHGIAQPLTQRPDCFANDRCNVSCIIEHYGYPTYQKQGLLTYPELNSGDYLVSQNMKHCLYLTHEGALKVMTDNFSVDVIPKRKQVDGPYKLKIGSDRIYLMSKADNSISWEMKTKSYVGLFPRLVMQNDRNIVVYSWQDEQAVWISGTKLLRLDQNKHTGPLV
ncbi:ATP synthase subunit atpF [Acrasis kona]|uniref:ATP synthase subunit atpF n=1 Tax=Acrasis kona TaxID=1008807 RepID=A0AAW2YZ85_9EUKA